MQATNDHKREGYLQFDATLVDNPLGRGRHRWEDNIKMHHREIGRRGVAWIFLVREIRVGLL